MMTKYAFSFKETSECVCLWILISCFALNPPHMAYKKIRFRKRRKKIGNLCTLTCCYLIPCDFLCFTRCGRVGFYFNEHRSTLVFCDVFLLVPDVFGRAGVSLCDKIICTMAPPIFCIYVIVYSCEAFSEWDWRPVEGVFAHLATSQLITRFPLPVVLHGQR